MWITMQTGGVYRVRGRNVLARKWLYEVVGIPEAPAIATGPGSMKENTR